VKRHTFRTFGPSN